LAVLAVGIGVGCGARTDTLQFDDGVTGVGGVSGGGHAGSGPSGGSNVGGTRPFGGYGGTSTFGGYGGQPFGGYGGTITFGGYGGQPFGGYGGTITFGGYGGSVSAGFGGVGAIGGQAGIGGTGGGQQLCTSVAQNQCQRCLCNGCYDALTQCVTDIGCALILACVEQSGCSGINCYQPGTCQPIIDKFGGIGGPSLKQVFGIAACASSSGCGCN